MDPAIALLAFLTLQRFVEFVWDRRNTQRLRAFGAVEFGGLHYPAMMLVHAGWLAGLWVLGYDRPVTPGFVIAFLLLQVARYWVLATLGRRWTTRVIVVPGAPLVEGGPYRLMRHPNYAIVAVELALVPLALGLPLYALVSVVLYAGTALLRIQVENSALAGAPARRPNGGIPTTR
jgi:methyltransferase